MQKFPETLKVAVLSTAHITEGDISQLRTNTEGDARGLILDEFEFGWWVWLGSEELQDLSAFSPEYGNLYHAAKAAGFDWLKLDCDGPESEAFPIMQI